MQSCKGAITHGLSGHKFTLTPDDLTAVARRVAEWGPALGPVGPREEWLVEQMAGASVRIDRCRTEEPELRSNGGDQWVACHLDALPQG